MNGEKLFAIAVTAAILACDLWCSTSLSADARKNTPSSLLSSAPSYQLDFSTFLGGSGFEDVRGLTLDAQGNIYVCGPTMSRDFPTTPGVHLTKVVGEPGGHGGHQFVAKFSPAGKLIWSTLLGNPEACEFPICMNVKVDAAGFVYVSGGAGPGFPTTPGVFQPKFQPGAPNNANAFVAKLKPDGSGLVWASYVGACQEVRDMDIDDAGDLYLQLGIDEGFQGTLPEAWFANAYQKTPHVHPTTYHEGDTGIIKVSNDGTKVHWATWIGGSKGNITKASVCVGRDHCPVLWMPTMSDDVPTTPGAYCRTMAVPPDADIGGRDGLMWLGKLSADGSCLLFGTYVGKGYLPCHNIAIDANGDIFVAAFQTGGGPWAVTPGAFQTKYGGGTHGMVVAKFSPSGQLLAGTYLGGSGGEFNCPDDIALDGQGNLLLVGGSKSVDYPVTAGAFQSKNEGANHAVFSLLSNDLSTMVYSSYFGTSSRENGAWGDMFRACAVGPDGTLYLAGGAAPFFPLKNAHQSTFGGGPCDGQIVKISPAKSVPVIAAAPTATPHPATVGQGVAFRVQATDPAGGSVAYRWDFGDFNSTSVAHGGTATHTYTEPGTYQVTVAVSNGRGGLATAQLPVTVRAVAGAPVIVTQPARQSVAVGQSVSLSVVATGQGPLSYQWQRYGANVPGATSATFYIPAAQATDTGTYRVVVTNSAGSTTSNYVDCQVDEPPAITAVSLDKDGVFRVAATGTRLNYQWQNNGQDIRHATAAIYVTPRGAADDPSLYTVVVSNPAGSVSSRGTPCGP